MSRPADTDTTSRSGACPRPSAVTRPGPIYLVPERPDGGRALEPWTLHSSPTAAWMATTCPASTVVDLARTSSFESARGHDRSGAAPRSGSPRRPWGRASAGHWLAWGAGRPSCLSRSPMGLPRAWGRPKSGGTANATPCRADPPVGGWDGGELHSRVDFGWQESGTR